MTIYDAKSYTPLDKLSYGKVHMYGIVENPQPGPSGELKFHIYDGQTRVLVLVDPVSVDEFPVKDGQIIRIHRAHVRLNRRKPEVMIRLHMCGCSVILWNAGTTDPQASVYCSSETSTRHDFDQEMLMKLNKVLHGLPASVALPKLTTQNNANNLPQVPTTSPQAKETPEPVNEVDDDPDDDCIQTPRRDAAKENLKKLKENFEKSLLRNLQEELNDLGDCDLGDGFVMRNGLTCTSPDLEVVWIMECKTCLECGLIERSTFLTCSVCSATQMKVVPGVILRRLKAYNFTLHLTIKLSDLRPVLLNAIDDEFLQHVYRCNQEEYVIWETSVLKILENFFKNTLVVPEVSTMAAWASETGESATVRLDVIKFTVMEMDSTLKLRNKALVQVFPC